jgi:hypothetical protein
MSLPIPTVISYVFSACLAGIAFAHTVERFGRYSFSKHSMLDFIAIYLFTASFVWYGKMVRDYWNATGTTVMLFHENEAVLKAQHELPTFAFTFAQSILAGILRIDPKVANWNVKSVVGLIAVHILAIICFSIMEFPLIAYKSLRIIYTLVLLLVTVLASRSSHLFMIRQLETQTLLRAKPLQTNKRLVKQISKLSFAAVFGVGYSIVSLITTASMSEVTSAAQMEYASLDPNSLRFVEIVCRDIYVWLTGWSIFCLLQMKLQDSTDVTDQKASNHAVSSSTCILALLIASIVQIINGKGRFCRKVCCLETDPAKSH